MEDNEKEPAKSRGGLWDQQLMWERLDKNIWKFHWDPAEFPVLCAP